MQIFIHYFKRWFIYLCKNNILKWASHAIHVASFHYENLFTMRSMRNASSSEEHRDAISTLSACMYAMFLTHFPLYQANLKSLFPPCEICIECLRHWMQKDIPYSQGVLLLNEVRFHTLHTAGSFRYAFLPWSGAHWMLFLKPFLLTQQLLRDRDKKREQKNNNNI